MTYYRNNTLWCYERGVLTGLNSPVVFLATARSKTVPPIFQKYVFVDVICLLYVYVLFVLYTCPFYVWLHLLKVRILLALVCSYFFPLFVSFVP